MLENMGTFLHLSEVFQMTLDFRADFLLSYLLYHLLLFTLSINATLSAPGVILSSPGDTWGDVLFRGGWVILKVHHYNLSELSLLLSLPTGS